MPIDFSLFTVFFGLGFLFNLWLVVALFVRPKSFWKVYDWQRNARPDLRDDTAYEGLIFFLPFIMLVVFGCGFCFMLYGWTQVLLGIV